MSVAQGGGVLCLGPFLAGKVRQLKSSALLWIVTIPWTNFEMATSQRDQPSVERALEQIADIEVEEEGESDPLEGLGNQEIAKIYHQLSPEDRQLFRQFKAFHKLHYDLYGHDAPSYQLTRGIVQNMFPGIPAHDTEVIAQAGAEILAANGSRSFVSSWDLLYQLSYSSHNQEKRRRSTPLHHLPCGFPLNKRSKDNKSSSRLSLNPELWRKM